MIAFFNHSRRSKKLFSFLFLFIFLLETTSVSAIGVNIIPTDPIPPVPIADSALRTKEYAITVGGITLPGINLDTIALLLMRMVVNRLSNYTVSWINSGFKNREGNVGFPLDLEKTLKNTADGIAGNLISQVTGSNALCSPFQANIKLALKANQNITATPNSSDLDKILGGGSVNGSCPLSTIIKNGNQGIKDFMDGDFIGGGGWDAWNVMTQDPTGNPYGSMFAVQAVVSSKSLSAVGIQSQQLDWAKGFLSTQDCIKKSPANDGTCTQWGPVKTPGSMVNDQLVKLFGSEVDQLNVASNFNQIVTALVGQLQAIIFKTEKGLFDPTNRTYTANGSGGSGLDASDFGTCSADKTFAITNKDTVTWTFSGGNDEYTTFEWAGTEFTSEMTTSTSSPKIKIIYTTEGRKTAKVTVTMQNPTGSFTPKLDANGNPVLDSNGDPVMVPTFNAPTKRTINCNNDVVASQYGPLKLYCEAVDPADPNTPLGRTIKPGTQILWNISISGGSGFLNKIDINEKDSFNMEGKNWLMKASEQNQLLFPTVTPQVLMTTFKLGTSLGPLYQFIGTPLPLVQTLNTNTNEKEINLSFVVTYQASGDWGLSFDRILDADKYVPVLDGASCSDKFTVDPDAP